MDFVYMRNLKNKNNACSKFSELNRKQATRVYYYRLTRRPKCAIIYIVRSLLSCWLWDFPIIMDVDLESSNPSTPTSLYKTGYRVFPGDPLLFFVSAAPLPGMFFAYAVIAFSGILCYNE